MPDNGYLISPTAPSNPRKDFLWFDLNILGWKRWSGSAWQIQQAGAVLAATVYQPTTKQVKTTTSTSYVDVDATNLAVTFVAPASGAVFVTLEAESQNATGQNVYWDLRSGSSDVAGTKCQIFSSANYGTATKTMYVSGLTPGQSYTYKWGWKVSSSTGSLVAGGTDDGPALMIVRDAGLGVTFNNPG